jgi:hypothetical protein
VIQEFKELPSWSFTIDEVSAGVYRASGRDRAGRSVEANGHDPSALIEECKRTVLEMIAEQRAKGIALIILGILLCSIAIVMLRVQFNSPVARWLSALGGLLMSFDVGLDVGVLSLCGCAALISGLLFLTNDSSNTVIAGWQIVRFLLHLAAIYAIAVFFTPRLAGWTRTTLLPFLKLSTSSSSFQFDFSHIFEFSFIPALVAGLTNAGFKHKAAQYVWLVPTIVLAYKFVTFPTPSVLDSASSAFPKFSAAFHQYFGGNFLIGEYRDWHEFWRMVESNPDMSRGMTQARVTAPFYAGVGYCMAAWIGLHFQVHQKFLERIKVWERWRFDRS